MRQLIDFKDMRLEDNIAPTDIDGLIEYKDSKYIILEIKYKNSEVSKGQRLALQRMVDDFSKAGKHATAIICEHTVRDPKRPVVAAWCKVREVYSDATQNWEIYDGDMVARDAIGVFINNNKENNGEK